MKNFQGCWELSFNDKGDDTISLHELDVAEIFTMANETGDMLYSHWNSTGRVIVNLANITYASQVVCTYHYKKKRDKE